MNAIAVIYVNDHLEQMRSQAQHRRLASLAERRSLRSRIGSGAAEVRRTLGLGSSGPSLPTLKNYPYGG